jgi:ADP-ribose pyrophosphatase YjhB (NUDIX family)
MSHQKIRAIAICLFSRGDRILVSEGIDPHKGDRFCRPLGGGIDFGERSQAAMQREIQEEIGAEMQHLQLLSVIENIFVYKGKPGHEIVFIYDAEFVDQSLYEKSVIHCHEHSNQQDFVASWRSLAEMQAQQIRLVPPELITLVQQIQPQLRHETT